MASNLPALMDQLIEKSKGVLSASEYNLVKAYIEKGGSQLAPETASKFFELFLNGSDIKEVWRLNKSFPIEAIHLARVKYDWDLKKDEYVMHLTDQVREKAVKAQLETTALLTDLLAATSKKNGDRLKKYIQTGDEKDLDGAMQIDSLMGLMKVIEGLGKITGADRVQKIDKKETVNVNINATSTTEDMTPETAAKILEALAESRRKKNEEE